ncbi:MAG TPA: sulfur carrier protein ThiS [Terriglobia bacterium]|nr:sulfur carrier protein ThiS [Terriglobia bacterium]
MITIHLNGQPTEVPEGLSLDALLAWLKLPLDRIAVEHNLEIVSRPHWPETVVQEGDRLEVVHFVGGGSDEVITARWNRGNFLSA